MNAQAWISVKQLDCSDQHFGVLYQRFVSANIPLFIVVSLSANTFEYFLKLSASQNIWILGLENTNDGSTIKLSDMCEYPLQLVKICLLAVAFVIFACLTSVDSKFKYILRNNSLPKLYID
jgi:hypothetical protein